MDLPRAFGSSPCRNRTLPHRAMKLPPGNGNLPRMFGGLSPGDMNLSPGNVNLPHRAMTLARAFVVPRSSRTGPPQRATTPRPGPITPRPARVRRRRGGIIYKGPLPCSIATAIPECPDIGQPRGPSLAPRATCARRPSYRERCRPLQLKRDQPPNSILRHRIDG